MLQLAAVVASVLVGLLRGGRLEGIGRFHLAWWPLAALAVVLQVTTAPTSLQLWLGVNTVAPYLYTLSFALLVLCFARNLALPGIALLLVGAGLNLVALLLNGLQMPADPVVNMYGPVEKQQALLAQGIWLHYRPIPPEEARLSFLGDWIYLGPPWPWPRIYSPGDLLVVAGGFWLIQHLMLSPQPDRPAPEPSLTL